MDELSILRANEAHPKIRKLLLEKQLNKIESEIDSLQEISQYIKEKIKIYKQMMNKQEV